MAKFAHDNIVPNSGSGLGKKEQVAAMFNSIAGRYDFMNRFLSGGKDIRWRKKAIAQLIPLAPKNILDVATGTGDMALLAYKILAPQSITGIDISGGMIEVGNKKIAKLGLQGQVRLQLGDSATIKFDDNTFDAITVAFGVRNFENLEKGLAEMKRVLRPGGKLVVLEFSRPKQFFFKGLYNVYMQIISPMMGRLLAKNKQAYAYLNNSMQAFPEREELVAILKNAGFVNTYFKPLSLGICCIYCASK